MPATARDSDSPPPDPYTIVGDGPRERLLTALAQSIREQGFRGTTVADVVARARTSRRTFYEHFDDRGQALIALFDAVNDVAIRAIAAAVDPTAPWTTQVDQALDVHVGVIEAEPEITVSFVRELPALGAEAIAVQAAVTDRFADLIVGLVDTPEWRAAGVQPLPRHTAVLLVGGLRELIVYAVERGEDLSALHPPARDAVKAVLDPSRRRWV
ncbi:TetR/AcrR family transcriptional regulator [Paraconexibacter algicola]|uniref:TetR/AcrR family transcriptional regulator n=1 Tax=Paraconexibacter algicola TaxID=2133960 RepID=A0A2T4UG18_9ACTN|nr:TetR/AcrR family transcriptional regulator [Paraconexibacter algicola]PTL58186.1 TetR/AcrR family transcriptional regulator [Paraconexibacter algicola]